MKGKSIIVGDRAIKIIVLDHRRGHGGWGDAMLLSLGESFDRL